MRCVPPVWNTTLVMQSYPCFTTLKPSAEDEQTSNECRNKGEVKGSIRLALTFSCDHDLKVLAVLATGSLTTVEDLPCRTAHTHPNIACLYILGACPGPSTREVGAAGVASCKRTKWRHDYYRFPCGLVGAPDSSLCMDVLASWADIV